MRPARFTVTSIVDDDGIATAQSASAAGYLTLNGALISGGKWTGSGGGQQVLITSSSNQTGITFTTYGKDVDGKAVSVARAGTSSSAATVSGYWSEITGVYASSATAGTVKVGFSGAAATPTYVVNYRSEDFMASLAADVTGTLNGTVQHTFDDVWSTSWREGTGVWRSNDDADLVGFTANVNGNYQYPPVATRAILNSSSNAAVLTYTVIVPS